MKTYDINPGGMDIARLCRALEVLIDAAETEDDIGTVIRIHTLMEQALEVFLEFKGDKADGMFFKKLQRAEKQGFPSPAVHFAKTLNNFRNRVAHEFQYRISSEDRESLHAAANALGSIAPGFVLLEARSRFGMRAKGKDVLYGSGDLRVDVLLMVVESYKSLIVWLVLQGIEKADARAQPPSS